MDPNAATETTHVVRPRPQCIDQGEEARVCLLPLYSHHPQRQLAGILGSQKHNRLARDILEAEQRGLYLQPRRYKRAVATAYRDRSNLCLKLSRNHRRSNECVR